MSKKIFRETALERLSSPEQLDRMIRVTSPRGWMSLTALWAAVGAVIAWAFLGRVPTTEVGKGILIATGGLQQVVAPSSGRLKSIAVSAGDEVKEGQVIAEIDKKDLEDQLGQLRRQHAELLDRKTSLDDADETLKRLDQSLDDVKTEQLDLNIKSTQDKIVRRTSYRASVEDLVKQGMMTGLDVDKVTEEIETLRSTLDASKLQKNEIVAKGKAADAQRRRDQLNRQFEVNKAARDVELLQSRIDSESKIVSRAAGRVSEVRVAANTAVQDGEIIVQLQSAKRSQGDLTAVLYVAAGPGKSIKKDFEVKVLPSTVKREEHGSMLGTVERVASGPTSRSRMAARLGDTNLVDQFVREVGLPLEIEVTLTPDTTTSGYKWTSGQGPPVRISEGTLCTAWVTIKRQRPIALVIPLFGDES